MELARWFGFLHPALVHFPLVLLLVSVALEAVGFVRREPRWTWAAQLSLLVGTVAVMFAFVAGNFAEIWAARDGIPQDPMEQHELLATITSWLFVFLAAGRLFLRMGQNRRGMAVYLVFAVAGCILLGITGHKGAMLVYERGAGVHAPGLHNLPTNEDLFTLRQRQDPDAIYYSAQMHHVFGWMIFLLSLMLLTDLVSPRWGERLRRIAPFLLLAGGVFLMVFSDQDAWPLYQVRPYISLWNKEVLMHKTYATLMLVVGGLQLRQMLRRRGDLVNRRYANRLMAVFALVGGGLLFTHVHTGAAYANVAAGVYVHHTALGILALLIGAVKLAEDNLQHRRDRMEPAQPEQPILHEIGQQRLQRGLAGAYPILMLTVSIFLINYNEGLPWFLGYRSLSLTAPHGGLIAPLGSDRAELCFDPATQHFDLYVMRQASNQPLPIAPQNVQLVIKEGSDSTALALAPAGGAARGSDHYVGTAPFLANLPLFQAQAWVYHDAHATPDVADFEPWTDARKARLHSTARYVCPMHPEEGANAPGKCPQCGMALVARRAPRAYGILHDEGFRMDLQAVPMSPAPGQTVHLTFTPRRTNGTVLTDLDVIHTKKLHLIVASRDLAFFDHVHPVPQSDGTLTLDYAFPAPGAYSLYADLTPTNERNQVFRLPITVAGTAPVPQPLVETPAQAKVFGNYRVSLALSPDPAATTDETALVFTVFEKGKPVYDLEPFLGAGGHCVALSEDGRDYLHSHPIEMAQTGTAQSGDKAAFGPTVVFHTRFTRPGLYKVWGQFQHRGKPLTADFTLRVR